MHLENTQQVSPEQLVLAYGEYLNQQNIDQILSLYTDQAEIIPDQLASLQGGTAIVEFYQNTFNSIKIEGGLQIKSVDIYADVAIVRCEEPAQVTELATGQSTAHYFRELFVLIKKEGRWFIDKYMFSQNDRQA
ncbi:nuclear transport factor 2 family protein [Acinetobacter sp. 187]|nr:nuclear transport factor 2 family protein [Acinetobacter lanii]